MKTKNDRVRPSTSIRVSVDLLLRLSAYRDRLFASACKNPRRYPPGFTHGKFGMADCIAYLLYQDDCHDARRRAHVQRAATDVDEERFVY